MNTKIPIPPIPHVRVSGSAHQRGVLVGELTRSRIEHSIDTYQRLFSLCDISWSDATNAACRYQGAIAKVSPDYLEELRGIADGAALDFDSLLALNCRTEILPSDFLSRVLLPETASDISAKPSAGPESIVNECTSFAVAGKEQNYWLAQNWDWCGLQRQSLCVIESHCAEHAHITVTEAGMLAKIGINSFGMAITLNILRSDKDGVADGLPVHFLLRALLDCESVNQAIDVVSSASFSSSSNIMVLDADGHIASFELSPYGVRVLEPEENQLCHTNHFLDDGLAVHDIGRPGNTSTLNRLKQACTAVDPQMSRANIIDVLSDKSDGADSICRFADPELPDIAQIETVTAVIMNTAEKTLCVSGAQPSVSDFVTYSL